MRTRRKEFGANLGLAVSLKQDGDLVRAAYNLIDTGTDKNIAGDSITAPVSDLFTIEDKLTSGVADALHINLRTEERQALGAHATTLPEAYQYYVEGVGYLGHSAERESLTSAEIVFKQALKLDPNYGPAEAGLGETYWYLYDMTKQKRWIESAQQTCAKAIELGNAGADGPRVSWNHRKRHRTIRKGCRAVPAGCAARSSQRSMHMSSSPRLTRISTSSKKPRKPTNEESVFARSTGEVTVRWECFMSRQSEYDKAQAMFEKALSLKPNNYRDYSNLGAVLLYEGKDEEATRDLERSIAIRPSYYAYENLGAAYLRLRKFDQAARNTQEALKLDDSDYQTWGNLGDAYYYGGNKSSANGFLQEGRFPWPSSG